MPRAYQWVDGSAYVTHVELVRKARGAELPERFWTDPAHVPGASDSFVGPRDPIQATSEDWGIDLEAEVAVITDDVPMGTPAALAGRHIKLVLLVNDVTARALIPDELAKGFGFLHGKPASAFSPVAVTPDELGDAWRDTSCLPLLSFINGKPFGKPDAGTDMTFDFARLIEHAAKTRRLGGHHRRLRHGRQRGGARRRHRPFLPGSGGCWRRSGTASPDALARFGDGCGSRCGTRPAARSSARSSRRSSATPARRLRRREMSKAFASQGDLAEKRETFTELAAACSR